MHYLTYILTYSPHLLLSAVEISPIWYPNVLTLAQSWIRVWGGYCVHSLTQVFSLWKCFIWSIHPYILFTLTAGCFRTVTYAPSGTDTGSIIMLVSMPSLGQPESDSLPGARPQSDHDCSSKVSMLRPIKVRWVSLWSSPSKAVCRSPLYPEEWDCSNCRKWWSRAVWWRYPNQRRPNQGPLMLPLLSQWY